MRRCIRLVYACSSGAKAGAAPPPAVVEASASSSVRLYQKCLNQMTSAGDVASLTAALLRAIGTGELALHQRVQLLRTLAARSIRYEDVMLKCLWAVFKAPSPTDDDFSEESSKGRECYSLSELSVYTSSAFQVMAEQRFLNDPQMTAVALGRCVELIPYASLDGLRSTYRGLMAVNRVFFSVAEVAHHSSEVTERMTTKEFYETADVPDEETLRHQPNLLDVLCGEVELQLRRLCDAFARGAPGPFEVDDALPAPVATGALLTPSAARDTQEAQWFLDVLEALAVVGVLHASTLDSLTDLVSRYCTQSSAGFFIKALTHATLIEERVVDPLTYEESAGVRDARRRLMLHLSGKILQVRGIHGYLRRHPQELLLLRRLFEHDTAETTLSPDLWDTVRTIHVAHRHTVAASQTSRRPVGALFQKMYDVKVKPISVDNAETERFVPPEFKTWRSPAATPRGGHPRNRRPLRRMAFGTRRISKNYIKNKQEAQSQDAVYRAIPGQAASELPALRRREETRAHCLRSRKRKAATAAAAMLDPSEPPRPSVQHVGRPAKADTTLSRGRNRQQGPSAQSLDRGAYHLAPLDRALATVAAPHLPVQTRKVSLPFMQLPAPLARQLVSSDAVIGPVQMWPAVTSSRQRRRQAALNSKAPFALQLEAFIRREHQQYRREHPLCSRADCLHIFREVFSTFVNHFSEYKGILSIIREEYDAALNEMSEKVKQMQMEYLESQTDRELHAMEIIQLKESMNATISNQKAQLSAAQELVHAMRDQVTAAEHANSLLTLEMEQKRKTHMEAQQQVKLLSHAMIEESARTAAARESTRKMEKESQLQEARITVLKEKVAELEEALRRQTYAQIEGLGHLPTTGAAAAALRGTSLCANQIPCEGGDATAGTYSKHFVTRILARIDALEMQLAMVPKKNTAAPAGAFSVDNVALHPKSLPNPASGGTVARDFPAARSSVDAALPVIREWLQREGVGEAEVEPTDVIVPPGRNPSEAMGFLSATLPVKHRHLSLPVTLQLMESMWAARAKAPESSRLPQFFLEWLQTQAGNPAEAKALGVNLLDTCQHNIHHPDCRALLAILRGFLPEELVRMCRRRIVQLRLSTATSAATLHNKMAFDAFFVEVRAVCPEKSLANMLHLRFTVFRSRNEAGEVELGHVLSEDSYFVTLFKQQWLQEVEAFTLRVVEGIRDESDEKRNSASLAKATRVLQRLDAALGEEVYTYVSLASQRPVIDVSATEGITVPLDAMLRRFRTSVLLYRRSPEELVDI